VPPIFVDRERERHEKDIRNSVRDFADFKDSTRRDDEELEKLELLNRINVLEKSGYPPCKRMTSITPLDEVRYELYRITREVNKEKSVKWLSETLVTGVRGLEMANTKYNPFGLKLGGFSRNVLLNLDEYKPALLALHTRWGSQSSSTHPLLQLLMTLVGSALFHHVSVVAAEESNTSKPLSKAGKVITSLAGGPGGGSGGGLKKGGLAGLANPLSMMGSFFGGGGNGATTAVPQKMESPPSSVESSDNENDD